MNPEDLNPYNHRHDLTAKERALFILLGLAMVAVAFGLPLLFAWALLKYIFS